VSAASLQKPVSTPVAAAPAGGVTPVSGQGFVPAGGATAAQGSAPAGAPSDGSIPAQEGLEKIFEMLKDEYGSPIMAPDGTIYMERKKASAAGGTVSLSYLVVGKVDKATQRLKISPELAALIKSKGEASEGGQKKLVKVGDEYTWQVFSKGEDDKLTASVTPASDEEVAAYQQQVAAQQAQQASQAKLQDRGDWQQKIGTVAQGMGIFGSTGQLLMGLSGGPNPYSGKPGAGWISGYILATRLNGKAEGKLLPQFMQSGPFASALEWGIQAYGMLDLGNDIRIVKDFVTKQPPLPAVNPNAVASLVKQGYAQPVAEAMAGLGSELRVPLDPSKIGAAASQLVDGSANAAMLRTVVPGVKDAAGKMVAGAAETSLTMVPKSDLHAAFAATDPVQSAGLKLRSNIDSGVVKGLGTLKGLVQPAMIGATALGLVSSAISVKNLVATKGAKVLVDTQGGRGALLGALSSAAFLGMYLVPMVLPGLGVASAAVMAASSAANIASNVLGGVQLLNSYGLFGADPQQHSFLDKDAFRAAFLIPPLTPIGAFAFWAKHKKQKAAEEAAKLEAAAKYQQQRIEQQREMAKLQLQSTGQIAGATQGPNGSIQVSTGVPTDPARIVAMLAGGAAAGAAPGAAAPAETSSAAPAAAPAAAAAPASQQQLAMTIKPMR
jgi:hypothetical protein